MKTKRLFVWLILVFVTLNLSAQNLNLYVSDAGNFNNPPWKIVKYDQNGENPEVFIDDNLAWPQDILFLEDQGVVLVSSLSSGRITKHDAETGAFIEDFANGIAGPTRMKIGADNLIYVLQWGPNTRVLRYAQDGTPQGEFTDIDMNQSIGFDWDAVGNLYVSSYNGNYVQKFNSSGASQGVFINSDLSGPTNVWIEDGVMFVLSWNNGKVVRFDVSNGQFIDDFITGLVNPEGIDRLPGGDFLIGDNGSNSVRRFDNNGNDLGDYTTGGNLITPNAVVLRDATLNIPDKHLKLVLVTPTMGTRFNFTPAFQNKYNELRVYNIQGKLMTTIQTVEKNNFDASGYTEGIYFLIAQNNTESAIQKIIVKNK